MKENKDFSKFPKRNLSLFMSNDFLSNVVIYITDRKLGLKAVNRTA